MNVGIVGLGVMGGNHKRVYEKLGHNVTDIYDPFVFPGQTLGSFIDSCHRNNVLGISICNPSDQHVDTSLQILQKIPEIYLLIEKPVSLEVEEAKKLLPYKNRILVGHIEQFNRGVVKLREWIDGGEFGKIFSIRTKRVNNIPSREPIKNVATDLLVHDIEVVNSLIGLEPTFSKVIKKSTNDNHIYDHAHAILQYDDIVCYCEVNWISPVKERYLEIYYAQGFIRLDYSTQTITFVGHQGNTLELLSNKEYQEPLMNEIKHFTNLIESDIQPKVLVNTSINVLEIINEDF